MEPLIVRGSPAARKMNRRPASTVALLPQLHFQSPHASISNHLQRAPKMQMDETLGKLTAGEDLSFDEMTSTMEAIMRGEVDSGRIGVLLISLREKGETVDEIAGAALALRRHMTPIRSRHKALLDTCGPGGGGSKLFNVSTATALVAAAGGVPVAKHGNHSVTSNSGSADVLSALGVRIDPPVDVVEKCLDELGLCFCYARQLHPAMRHVAAIRKELGVRTIFNLLGPLSNPASATHHLMGVPDPKLTQTLADALQRLGVQRAAVVTGEDGLSDVTLAGATDVAWIDGQRRESIRWSPGDFGLETASLESLEVADAVQSAAIIRDLLAGASGPARDLIILNAAAAIHIFGLEEELPQAAARATHAIDSGAAADKLAELAARTQS